MPELGVHRVIIFAKDMARMIAFYGDVVGLSRVEHPQSTDDFVSFHAGGVQLSLHRIPEHLAREIEIADPPAARASTPIKVVFGAADVHGARTELVARGANLGPVHEFGDLHLCDGVDPEGNIFQLASRV